MRPLPATPATDAAGLRAEAVVVAHNQLRFDLLDGIHCYADYDQQGGSAEVEVYAQTTRNPGWQTIEQAANEWNVVEMDAADHHCWNQHYDDQVDRANQSDSSQDIVDEV